MKKSKLSLCLASSFVAALSLVACNSVSSKEGAVVTIKNYNGQEVDLLTDAVYNKYRTETDGVSKFYNAILEALIRYEYSDSNSGIRQNKDNWAKAIKSSKEIEDEAKNNVENDKNTAEQNAKTNDTSYEDEWDAILESHNCEDENELLEYYIYQLEKEDISEKFLVQQKDSTLLTEWLGINDKGEDPKGKAKAAFPYHIRHVLASISGGSTNFYDGTITASEAKKLGDIMDALLNPDYKFGRVAVEHSGDSGSGAKSGDVGIMTTTTSFVNEFKLGIYAYDAIYTHQNDKAKDTIKKGLGIDDEYKLDLFKGSYGIESAWTNANGVNGGVIQEVPFGVFQTIRDLADTEKATGNKLVNKGNEHYYPRNILYNYYLNFHNPFVITKQVIDESGADDASSKYGLPKDYTGTEYDERFTTITLKNGDLEYKREVLTDEAGHVIIGCRSEHGIHFMIMEKSIYDYREASDNAKQPTLEEYYTSLTPSDSNFPKTSTDEQKETYVASLPTSEQSEYTTRANEIKSAVQSFDSTYDYRLYEYILKLEDGKLSIKDADLKTAIGEYISRTRESNNDNAYKTLNEAWRSYTELVALQYDNRTDYQGKSPLKYGEAHRTIHPRCAIGFKDRQGEAEWVNDEKGKGLCWYEE